MTSAKESVAALAAARLGRPPLVVLLAVVALLLFPEVDDTFFDFDDACVAFFLVEVPPLVLVDPSST